jgi:hypothetical protein
LLDIHAAGQRRILRRHRQQCDLESAAAESGERIENRFVLGGDADQMVAATSWTIGETAERKLLLSVAPLVKTISRGETLSDRATDSRAASTALASLRAERVAGAARVSIAFDEVRPHRLGDPWIDPGRGMIVEVDGTFDISHFVGTARAAFAGILNSLRNRADLRLP